MQNVNEENQQLIENIKAMIIEAAACVEAITKPSTGKQLLRAVRGLWKTTEKSERLVKLLGYVNQMQNYPLSAEIDQAKIDALLVLVGEIELAYSVWWRKTRETDEQIPEDGDKKIKEVRLNALLKEIKDQLREIDVVELPVVPVVPVAIIPGQQPAALAASVAYPFAAVQPQQQRTGQQLFGVAPAATFAAKPTPTIDPVFTGVIPAAASTAQQPSPTRAGEFTVSYDQDESDSLGPEFLDAPSAQDDDKANNNASYIPFQPPIDIAALEDKEKSVSQLRATLRALKLQEESFDGEEAYEEQDPNFGAPQVPALPTSDKLSQHQGVMANLQTVKDEAATHTETPAPDKQLPLIDYRKPELERVREEMKLKAERRKNAPSKVAAADNNAARAVSQPQHDAPFAAKMQFFGAKTNAVAAPAKAKAATPAKAPVPAKAPAVGSAAKAPAKAPAGDSESKQETPKF